MTAGEPAHHITITSTVDLGLGVFFFSPFLLLEYFIKSLRAFWPLWSCRKIRKYRYRTVFPSARKESMFLVSNIWTTVKLTLVHFRLRLPRLPASGEVGKNMPSQDRNLQTPANQTQSSYQHSIFSKLSAGNPFGILSLHCSTITNSSNKPSPVLRIRI